ncbi:magnesium transporter [Litoreibacter halocynthiae]|uniref:Magnesium transporter MgtE n=1 Tax=Litoreibacter halocynthiae TaxID=1242689 RepID=A0A4R7LKG3_9RHOB|nr:magnesium transporter [Litoreibacter halocynthiae]TDT74891.1 magnesium transporter [Litoreibacter halocynthiae]
MNTPLMDISETRETDISDAVEVAFAQEDATALNEILERVTISEALRVVLDFSSQDRDSIISLLSPELASRLIDEAPLEVAADLMEGQTPAKAVEIFDELDSDVQADVIAELDAEDAEALLAGIDPDDAAGVRRLTQYAAGTAGGLMLADAFQFRRDQTVGAVLRSLASDDEDLERYNGQHPYIIDDNNHPVGVVSLRGLLTAKRSGRLEDIMVKPMTVPVQASLTELQDLFNDYDFLGFPVVDEDGALVGVVSRIAVDAAILARSETENLRMQGIVGDELRTMPLAIRSRRRLAWLSANIVLNIIAASVISAYEETLAAAIAIAVFLPMVSDMSGCSGNQAVGVTMRELSLGLVRPKDAMRVWLKEVSVGAINGVVLGILIGIVCWVWKGNAYLGLVIGLALALNTMIAVSIGGVVPLLLKRVGQDPAVASGPLLTTITDMAGFFLVLSLATLMMPLLLN